MLWEYDVGEPENDGCDGEDVGEPRPSRVEKNGALDGCRGKCRSAKVPGVAPTVVVGVTGRLAQNFVQQSMELIVTQLMSRKVRGKRKTVVGLGLSCSTCAHVNCAPHLRPFDLASSPFFP